MNLFYKILIWIGIGDVMVLVVIQISLKNGLIYFMIKENICAGVQVDYLVILVLKQIGLLIIEKKHGMLTLLLKINQKNLKL